MTEEVIYMKKQYETPEIEVIRFRYSDQVVAASGSGCYLYFQWYSESCRSEKLGPFNN